MQDYLIVKGQIDPIENENALEIYKANEWQKLDRIACATIRMHWSESVYFTVQSCTTTFCHDMARLEPMTSSKTMCSFNH